MTQIDIRREADRYVATIPGKAGEAELTFTRDGDVLRANHTGAPPALRGTGAALALVTRMVEDARAEGLKVDPRCSYVAHQFDRHRDWTEVRA